MASTCCPPGLNLVYIAPTGYYDDIIAGNFLISNYGPGVIAVYGGMCAALDNGPGAGPKAAVGSAYATVADCPCCHNGFTYSSNSGDYAGICVDNYNHKHTEDPILCIVCNCVTSAPYTCPPCGTSGETIDFVFDFYSKQCTVCTAETDNPPPDECFNSFVPYFIASPIVANFRLKHSNFI